MDWTDQTRDLRKIADALSMQAMEFPPDERHAFIEGEVAGMRRDFDRIYAGNPAIAASASAFADGIEHYAKAAVEIIERLAAQPGMA